MQGKKTLYVNYLTVASVFQVSPDRADLAT